MRPPLTTPVRQIDHIGIAVRSIEQATVLFRDILGLEHLGDDLVEDQGVKVAFFKAGEVKIELLEPLSPDSPVGRFLDKRGQGVHHVALRTDDIEAASAHLSAEGLKVLYDAPRDGAHGKLINFIHPADTFGVLLELTQRRGER